ncbi:aldehyde dehydrogenase (NAD) family protein [Alicycliphilus sp. B1]|nr:aldehyde dehydrogenase (NAD) family protein [Alicycliphilus sp. B1]
MRHGDGGDQFPARALLRLGHGEGAGQHVGAHVAGQQHRVGVQRIGQLAVGEGGAVGRGFLAAADDGGGATRAAQALAGLDADAAFGVVDARERAAQGVEHVALAFLDDLGGQAGDVGGGRETGQAFDDGLAHGASP